MTGARAWGTLSLFGALGIAPYQCARSPKPELAREETPGDALYNLAEDFKRKNDPEAAHATLRFLVEHYPSSRHSQEAREELGMKSPP